MALSKNTSCVEAVKLHVSNRTLQELFRIALIKSVTFVVFEILSNLVSMQNVLNANNCWRKQNFENFPTWLYLYLSCTFRIIIWFCLIFGFLGCRKCCQFYKKSVFIVNEASQHCVTMWKRFSTIMATIWYERFWQNICPVENRNL